MMLYALLLTEQELESLSDALIAAKCDAIAERRVRADWDELSGKIVTAIVECKTAPIAEQMAKTQDAIERLMRRLE